MNLLQLKNRVLKSKVFENYFSMTSLQVFGSLIGILLYPYLIRTLGKDSYGLYVFALSIVSFFGLFIAFGFAFPAIKEIVLHRDDRDRKNHVLACVFTAKSILSAVSLGVFLLASFFIPIIKENLLLFMLCFLQPLADLFFPQWYFQAVQKMKFVTVVQLACRLLTIPFIFLFIHTPADTWIYALIVALSLGMGSAAGVFILWKNEGVVLRFAALGKLKCWFKDALPFFWTSSASTLKGESATLIIGTFFGFDSVALYDLAKKIVSIPRLMTNQINAALFPRMVGEKSKEMLQKILHYEWIVGLIPIVGITMFGYWIVLLMGGRDMLAAYPLTVVLSITILTWLVVGAYINFIFVPQGRYYFVTRNQVMAFLSFAIFCGVGLLFWQNIMIPVAALSFSGIAEIVYCRFLIRKYHLL